jgi:hypothetical protein
MRPGCVSIVLIVVCLVPAGAAAQDGHAFVEGVGGLRLTSAPGTSGSVGGIIGASLAPNIQAIGEVGRTSDVLPSAIDTVIAFTPVDFRVSSFYGAGGVRLVTTPHGHVSAYAETLAGVTRLNSRLGGVGSPTTDAIVNTALRFVNTTDPLAAAGVGVIFQAGPLVANVGYRFTRIFASDALASLLTGGNLDVSEVRVGIGVRF